MLPYTGSLYSVKMERASKRRRAWPAADLAGYVASGGALVTYPSAPGRVETVRRMEVSEGDRCTGLASWRARVAERGYPGREGWLGRAAVSKGQRGYCVWGLEGVKRSF